MIYVVSRVGKRKDSDQKKKKKKTARGSFFLFPHWKNLQWKNLHEKSPMQDFSQNICPKSVPEMIEKYLQRSSIFNKVVSSIHKLF